MKNKEYDLTTFKGRLLHFLRSQRFSQTEFAEMMGVAPTYIGAMRKGMSRDKVAKMSALFPMLNRDWLLYGEGEMLKGDGSSTAVAAPAPATTAEDVGGSVVPLLPINAFAGGLQEWSDGVRRGDCETILSPVSGVDFAIRISGDSMEPRFHDGTTVLIKRINEKAFIPWGNTMVIDTENGVVMKDVYPSELGKDFIEARSLNPKYPPLSIPTTSIYGLYRVMGSFKLYSTY